MKRSQRTVVGVTLIAGAIVLGIIIQFFGPGLVTTSAPPIPKDLIERDASGVTISNYTVTTYHWPLFALVLILIGGVLCLFGYSGKFVAEKG